MKRIRIGAPQRVGSASVIRERGSAYCPPGSGLVHRDGHPRPDQIDGYEWLGAPAPLVKSTTERTLLMRKLGPSPDSIRTVGVRTCAATGAEIGPLA